MADAQDASAPKPIRRLEESLVNKIAAGEIIHRPASALKELIENSLDAKATSIRITVKDGGMKLLQIQDNGTGIRKTDLPILAERFTTSKLQSFSDLSSLQTFGFRGEALASISHVAHLSVTTKTKSESCAWKAYYLDGSLTPAKPGQSSDPKPCAGNTGTTITAEDLFYNTPTRLAALRNSNEEYHRILDVVTRYAVHNPAVSFVCKKAGSSGTDISTPSNSTVSQAINLLYGATVARDLLHTKFSSEGPDDMDVDESERKEGYWKADAHFTGTNYHAKKLVFLLFINHRLVESQYPPKGLESIRLPQESIGSFVDVNVHPTKREVHFLDEEVIVEKVADAIQKELAGQGKSRTFQYQTQTLLTGGTLQTGASSSAKGKWKEIAEECQNCEDNEGEEAEGSATQPQKKIYSKDKIRTSHADRTLDSMFAVVNPSTQASGSNTPKENAKYRDGVEAPDSANAQPTPTLATVRTKDIEESVCYLTSVTNLRKAVTKAKHSHLTEIMQSHTFVGIVDLRRSLSLVQHEKRLYLLNHSAMAEELFYQLSLRQFGNLQRLRLDPPPSIRRLVKLAVKAEKERWRSAGLDLTPGEMTDRIVEKITAHAEMLDEYFSISINDKGELESLPLLLRDYTPNLDKLPLFLMRLGPQVNWVDEQECFTTFLHELAYFYSPGPLLNEDTPIARSDESQEKAERWQIQHVLFPYARRYLAAPKSLLDRDVIQVASLPDLYRVFERC
ncbi:DNA mismatch repair protein MutL [Schizopora paradoxa]|uniref:DNA mismatch repair protein MutL n=1 Tax=Schizopora paradoxa TaxID=27342 RepID=A0A0H2RWB4_9AGAM|nr:DNA mismatch repair protein MutL [Schizopora paradoxa]